MRLLKFRQWNPSAKAFHYWGYVDGDDTFTSPIHGGSQQFTGLLDRQGKEIYEGDIVKQCFNKEWWSGVVSIMPTQGTMVNGKPLWIHNVEVIGNIYEGLYSGEHCDILKVWNGNTERQSQGRSKDTGLLKKQSGKSG